MSLLIDFQLNKHLPSTKQMLDISVNAGERKKWMTHHLWWSQVPMREIKQMISCEHEVLWVHSYTEKGQRTWGIQIHLGRKSTDKGTRHRSREEHVQSQGSLMEHGTLRKLTNARCGAAIKGQNDRLAQKWMDLCAKLESELIQWDESIKETYKGLSRTKSCFFRKLSGEHREDELVRKDYM